MVLLAYNFQRAATALRPKHADLTRSFRFLNIYRSRVMWIFWGWSYLGWVTLCIYFSCFHLLIVYNLLGPLDLALDISFWCYFTALSYSSWFNVNFCSFFLLALGDRVYFRALTYITPYTHIFYGNSVQLSKFYIKLIRSPPCAILRISSHSTARTVPGDPSEDISIVL